MTDRQHRLSLRARILKRTFDIFLSAIGLVVFSGLIIATFLIASIDTRTNGFFVQIRVGRWGELFKVIKIRTMRPFNDIKTTVTTVDDVRITRVGQILRKLKLDELPQLINVLAGDMSFVGPRPDVPGFADLLEGDDRIVLSIRPGITGPATLHYRDEETLLAGQKDPERYNRDVIFPDKIRLNRHYIENYRFRDDLRLIWRTLFK